MYKSVNGFFNGSVLEDCKGNLRKQNQENFVHKSKKDIK